MRFALQTEAGLAYRAGAGAFFLAVAVILAALAFEYIGGYAPCPLCLQERYAYYAGIPGLFLALVLLVSKRPRLAGVIFVLVALGFAVNTALGVYHAGVELGYWPGPDACAATIKPLGSGRGGVLNDLANTRVIRCDAAPWHLLGLSFAGWNAVLSMVLTAAAAAAGARSWRN